MRRVLTLFLTMVLLAVGAAQADRRKEGEGDKARVEKKQRDKLESLSRRLAKHVTKPGPGELNSFVNARAFALLERARQAKGDSYRFDRLVRATSELIEAGERVSDSAEPDNETGPKDQEEAARRLERSYFRVQQSEYFAHLSGEPDADTYVKYCRSLYQQARTAYDLQQYRKARKLGDAAADIVSTLENLAQASVRVPEPPRLK